VAKSICRRCTSEMIFPRTSPASASTASSRRTTSRRIARRRQHACAVGRAGTMPGTVWGDGCQRVVGARRVDLTSALLRRWRRGGKAAPCRVDGARRAWWSLKGACVVGPSRLRVVLGRWTRRRCDVVMCTPVWGRWTRRRCGVVECTPAWGLLGRRRHRQSSRRSRPAWAPRVLGPSALTGCRQDVVLARGRAPQSLLRRCLAPWPRVRLASRLGAAIGGVQVASLRRGALRRTCFAARRPGGAPALARVPARRGRRAVRPLGAMLCLAWA
jgi:hypothetical protein